MLLRVLFLGSLTVLAATLGALLFKGSARQAAAFALRWGFGLGGAAFAAGFFGPLLLSPGSNQGPLLGIFITGPAGFLIGTVAGWIVALARGHGAAEGSTARDREPSQ